MVCVLCVGGELCVLWLYVCGWVCCVCVTCVGCLCVRVYRLCVCGLWAVCVCVCVCVCVWVWVGVCGWVCGCGWVGVCVCGGGWVGGCVGVGGWGWGRWVCVCVQHSSITYCM